MTRPCPAAAVGLECDRLAKAGIEAHYGGFLKNIFDGAGTAAGVASPEGGLTPGSRFAQRYASGELAQTVV